MAPRSEPADGPKPSALGGESPEIGFVRSLSSIFGKAVPAIRGGRRRPAGERHQETMRQDRRMETRNRGETPKGPPGHAASGGEALQPRLGIPGGRKGQRGSSGFRGRRAMSAMVTTPNG
ncbi:hypothetical protein HK102_011755, partial [Quaeritorhiza haematococci]